MADDERMTPIQFAVAVSWRLDSLRDQMGEAYMSRRDILGQASTVVRREVEEVLNAARKASREAVR
jgi:hypothetical protein